MSAPINRTSELARYLATLLTEITVANGYMTDIGTHVFRGRRNVDASNSPCCVLIEGEDDPQDSGAAGEFTLVKQRYAISAILRCDPDNPNDAANDAVEDITHALFQHGQRLGGRVKRLDYAGRDIGPRADGEATVQVVVHVDATIAQVMIRS